MAKYKCKICGYVFDEDDIEEGLNIPEGTKFDDLPASFKCPKCRMAKATRRLQMSYVWRNC